MMYPIVDDAFVDTVNAKRAALNRSANFTRESVLAVLETAAKVEREVAENDYDMIMSLCVEWQGAVPHARSSSSSDGGGGSSGSSSPD